MKEVILLDKSVCHDFSIPEESTLQYFSVNFYFPGANSIINQYNRLIAAPHGCTEQIASTTYLNALAIQRLIVDNTTPQQFKLIKQCEKNLTDGIKKLEERECKSGGFDWWSNGNEGDLGISCLIAQLFYEIKHCVPSVSVNETIIQSTLDWVLKQRKNGKFCNRNRHLAVSVAEEAYILWILTNFGRHKNDELKEELTHLFRYPAINNDPYVLALIALIYKNIDDLENADKICKTLAKKQDATSGYVPGAYRSFTHSYGVALEHETTSLVAIAWMKCNFNEYQSNIDKALNAIKKNDYSVSTQAIALSMKAKSLFLSLTTDEAPPVDEFKPFDVKLNGNSLTRADTVSEYFALFEYNNYFSLKIDYEKLTEGANRIEIENPRGDGVYCYIDSKLITDNPPSHPNYPIHLSLTPAKTDLKLGENLAIQVQVQNKEDNQSGMVTTEIGIPAGLYPNYKQLKELVKSSVCFSLFFSFILVYLFIFVGFFTL